MLTTTVAFSRPRRCQSAATRSATSHASQSSISYPRATHTALLSLCVVTIPAVARTYGLRRLGWAGRTLVDSAQGVSDVVFSEFVRGCDHTCYTEEMRRSVFCLCPRGWSPWTLRAYQVRSSKRGCLALSSW